MTTTDARDDVARFVDELLAETRARKASLLDGEFLAAVEAGSVTRDQIREWAKPFYAATKNGRHCEEQVVGWTGCRVDGFAGGREDAR